MLGSQTNHFFYQQCKTLFFYIQDPWDPRWETGVVGKLYRKNQRGSPVNTIKIQEKKICLNCPTSRCHFNDCWLCVPLGTNSQLPLMASLVMLPNNLTIVSRPDSDVTMTPYLFSIPLFGMSNSFKTSGTHPVGTLGSLDCNRTTLDTSSLPQCPAAPNTSILCDTQTYTTIYLPTGQEFAHRCSFSLN